MSSRPAESQNAPRRQVERGDDLRCLDPCEPGIQPVAVGITAYVAQIALGNAQRSHVHQIVCSPFRNPLPSRERRMVRLMAARAVGAAMRAVARTAGVIRPAADWRFLSGPAFDNSVAVLELDQRAAWVTVSRSGPEDEDGPALTPLHTRVLSAD